MKVTNLKLVDFDELSREVETQFGLEEGDVDMFELFDEGYENGSYQAIYIDEEALHDAKDNLEYAEQYRPEDADHYRIKLLLLTYLHDIFPEDDKVLWHCYW